MKSKIVSFALLLALLLASCDNLPLPATPTVDTLLTATEITPLPTPSLSITTTSVALPPNRPQRVQLEPPPPTDTPGPPTATFTLTPTLGPIEHTIQSGETLGYIIQLYGYTELGVIDQIVAMNPNVPTADRLPGAGSVILIPRPSATPTPAGFAETATAIGDAQSVVVQPDEIQTIIHRVRSGETILGIAGQYETNLVILDRLNPELLFFDCDFENPSGGPECVVPLQVDQEVLVPAPSPTPTLSPTPSGDETATPTPTYAAPMLVFPPEGGPARSCSIKLQWISAGILAPQYSYIVQVRDTVTNTEYAYTTRETSLTLDADITPDSGEPHQFNWRIVIGTQLESGEYRVISGSQTGWRSFTCPVS